MGGGFASSQDWLPSSLGSLRVKLRFRIVVSTGFFLFCELVYKHTGRRSRLGVLSRKGAPVSVHIGIYLHPRGDMLSGWGFLLFSRVMNSGRNDLFVSLHRNQSLGHEWPSEWVCVCDEGRVGCFLVGVPSILNQGKRLAYVENTQKPPVAGLQPWLNAALVSAFLGGVFGRRTRRFLSSRGTHVSALSGFFFAPTYNLCSVRRYVHYVLLIGVGHAYQKCCRPLSIVALHSENRGEGGVAWRSGRRHVVCGAGVRFHAGCNIW